MLIEELKAKCKSEESLNDELKRTNDRLLATISRIQIENLSAQSVTELIILAAD